jgi:ubiquinone/menaquinone biosynthesis C-methylase UbiE
MSRAILFDKIVQHVTFDKTKILDAGSGIESLTFLTTQSFKELWAVSYDSEEIKKLEEQISKQNTDRKISVLQTDLSRRTQFHTHYFDIIFADYFLAAVEGCSPYRTPHVIAEFKRIIKPKGRLIITGWNRPLKVNEKTNLKQRAIARILNLKDSVQLLLNKTPYREIPDKHVISIAQLQGFKLLHHSRAPHVATHAFFQSYTQSITNKATDITNVRLRQAMIKEATSILSEVTPIKDFAKGVAFGEDYVLIFK